MVEKYIILHSCIQVFIVYNSRQDYQIYWTRYKKRARCTNKCSIADNPVKDIAGIISDEYFEPLYTRLPNYRLRALKNLLKNLLYNYMTIAIYIWHLYTVQLYTVQLCTGKVNYATCQPIYFFDSNRIQINLTSRHLTVIPEVFETQKLELQDFLIWKKTILYICY